MNFIIPIVSACIISTIVVLCFLRIDELKSPKVNIYIIFISLLIFNIILGIILFIKYPFFLYFFSLSVLINILFMIAVIDYKTKNVPNFLLLPTLALGVITIFFIPGIQYYDALITSLVLGLIMFLVSKKSKDSFGMGDVKLLTIMALFFGFQKLLGIIFLSLVLGLFYGFFIMIKNKQSIKTEIPFIPFVFLSTLVNVLIR